MSFCKICSKEKTLKEVHEEGDRDTDMSLCDKHLRELHYLLFNVGG